MLDDSTDDLQFSPIPEIVEAIARGELVIVTDDPGRENEADLVGAAQLITPEQVNFMAHKACGLICAPLSREITQRLQLPLMVSENRESMRTAFTTSVDAAEGITTGISAADRALTLRLLADQATEPQQLVQPGHIFPLRAVDGGVLRRAGHTEAAVDLARMAGLQQAGVICEIMNPDGSMARVHQLGQFQKQHALKACTIADLIAWRRKSEQLIEFVECIKLPTEFGDFDCHLFISKIDGSHHLALTRGEINPQTPTLTRVHSECLTGDVFGSQRCDCGPQLHSALEQISVQGGVLLYLRQEGRGIGLPAKIQAYKLQEQGLDTVEANHKLGFAADLRDYGIGAQILHHIGAHKLRLLTNNPRKIIGLEGYGISVVEQVPLKLEANQHNAHYLFTKKNKLGHNL